MIRKFARLGLPLSLVVAPLSACGGDGADLMPTDCKAAIDGKLTVVAQNLAFDTDCLTFPAGQKVTIFLENKDNAVNHNIAVTGQGLDSSTPIRPGPTRQTLVFIPPSKGKFRFTCEPHSSTMTGEVWVT